METVEPLLEIQNLKVHFRSLFGKAKETVKAVDGISFAVPKGSTFGLVGESGCGKSTTARAVVRLNWPTAGQIFFEGEEITRASAGELLRLRRDIQMIFQDPYASLSARMTVQSIVAEPLQILCNNRVIKMSKREMDERVSQLLQRIGMARAIAGYPKLVICDEPISALDVSVQAQILNLLRRLQDELGLTYLFIAHDLTVVEYICDRIGVMYLGNLMEVADAADLSAQPLHPYTQMLFSAVLVPDPTQRSRHKAVSGEAELSAQTRGCPFFHRCPKNLGDKCRDTKPELLERQPGRFVACHLYD